MNGKVLLYADKETDSIKRAVSETARRRTLQGLYNQQHGITPASTKRSIMEMQIAAPLPKKGKGLDMGGIDLKAIDGLDSLRSAIASVRSEMKKAASDLEFERAAALRDKARELEQLELTLR